MNGFYNKFNQLEDIINTYNPSFFALNETRHHKKTKLNFTGYKIIQKSGTIDNEHAHGGVAIMIKNEIKIEEIKLNSELQVVAIRTLFPIKMTIVSIYIPPNHATIPTLQQLDELERQLPKPFMIVGDVNSRHINLLSTYTNEFGLLAMNFINNNNLVIINDDQVTRVGAHGESAILDLVIVTGDLAATFEVETTEDFYGSDHKLIKVNTVKRLVEVRTANYNYKRADMKKFQKSTKLYEIDLENDIDDINEQLKNKIISAADIAIPKYNPMFNSEKCKAWWSKKMKKLQENTKKLNRQWRRIKNSPQYNPVYIANKKSEYYKAKREFEEERDKAKKENTEKFCLSITKDTKNGEIWKKVRATEGKRSKTKSLFFYNEQDNSCITDKKIIAEKFSVEFLKNFENDSEISVIDNPVKLIAEKDAEYLNNNFRMSEMMRIIKKAKNTSPGSDKISYAMIKNLSGKDMIWLLDFLNKIWTEGKVPKDWKKSIAIPIPKDYTQKHNIEKYRPIQLINVTAKILQSMAAYRLNHHMECNNLNHKYQFGFRAKRSTTDNLMLFEDKIRMAIEKKCEVIAVFFDLAKAFDSVKSEKIIECLKEMGIHGKFMNYSNDFFTDLKFQVKFDGELSSEKNQENGVPQGSGLSVQYFKIVMDQMNKFIDNENIYMFVDDFVYIKIIKSARQKNVENDIQNDMSKIESWAKHFGLKISIPKTKMMKFTLKKDSPVSPSIMLNNSVIEEVESFKLLGVTFQKNLKFKQSIDEVTKRVEKDLNVLKYLASFKLNIDRKVLLHVLEATVKSKIDYMSFLAQSENRDKLQKKYNEGLRICLGALRTTQIDALHAEAGKIFLEDSALKKITRYVVNVLSNPDNPVYERVQEIFDEPEIIKKRRKVIRKRSALQVACKKVSELNIKNIREVKSYFTHPQWLNSKISIDTKVHMHNKDSLDGDVWRKIFASKIDHYKNADIIYTDGSLRNDRVAWAVTSESELIKNGRIHDKSTILTAEMRAIIEAVNNSESSYVVAVTDSLSTCELLKSMKIKNNNCRYIANELYSTNKRITLIWAPSHKGIVGNETADKYAGEAIESVESDEITENDAKNYVNKTFTEIADSKWCEISEEKNLRRLKNKIEMLVFPRTMSRIDQVKITRLRLGHTKYTDDWKFHQRDGYIGQACEVCECFTSVHHIFTECKAFENSRKKFNISFNDLNNTSKFEDIIAFIKEIGLYEKI